MNLSINGHSLHVETHGSNSGTASDRSRVAVLHHGLGSTRSWKEQIPALVQAGYHVIAYDRWGYGQSEARQGLDVPAFIQDIADLRALLEQLGVQRPTGRPFRWRHHRAGLCGVFGLTPASPPRRGPG
jgi:pimeloyl-ACP methyl ester carboxylesterase